MSIDLSGRFKYSSVTLFKKKIVKFSMHATIRNITLHIIKKEYFNYGNSYNQN